MMAALRRVPLVVVVLGATGTGKSKLGIELGRYFKGEIISADSIQMYQGLDVISNKVTAKEEALCPHHLISVLSPLSTNNTVTYFRNMALPIIERLLEENKLPIIVGGTNYYIEALLWNFLIDKEVASSKTPVTSSEDESENVEKEDVNKHTRAKKEKEGKYASYDTDHLYTLLQKVDPDSAKRLHPNNRRKLVRALEVYDQHGIPMSAIHQAQHQSGNTPGLSGGLRYPNCCIFWLQCEKKVLNKRLDERVDEMMAKGLASELHELRAQYLESVNLQEGEPDYTLGIFQNIGFKEFHKYLTLEADQRESPLGQEFLSKGIQELKLATRQYARKQLQWIKNRFVHRPGSQVPPVYALDATDPNHWDDKVFKPAVEAINATLKRESPSIQPVTPEKEKATKYVQNTCDFCGGRVFVTLHEWQEHLHSKKHKKMMQQEKKREGMKLTTQESVTKRVDSC